MKASIELARGLERPSASARSVAQSSIRATPQAERLVPGCRKALRARSCTQLVERLERAADMHRGRLDDAGDGKMCDKSALEIGRDRIAPRLFVPIGREFEQRIAV